MNISGRTDIVISSLSFSDATESKPTGTIIYTVSGSLDSAIASAPALGTQTEYFPDIRVEVLGGFEMRRILLKNRSFKTDGAGNMVTVTLTYGVIDGESNSTGLEEPGETSYSLTSSESTASILLHPKFANISEAEQIVAKALLDGTRLFDLVWRHKTKLMMSSTEPADPENWHEKETLEDAIKTVVQSDAGKLLIKKIRKGVTSYCSEKLVWTETGYARSLSAAASGLSQIETPPGDPPDISGDWRRTGVEANKTESERYWEIKKTWTASDVGSKWDTDLYGG